MVAGMGDTRATIALTGVLGRQYLDLIQGAVPDELVVATDDPRAEHAEVLLVLTRDRDLIAEALTPRVRWIHSVGAGVDGFPFDLVGDRAFTCSRGVAAVPIAEWVMAMILARAKRLPESWVTDVPEHMGFVALDVLAGQTVGLVGLGAIGTEIARRAVAFDMEVLAYRRTAAPSPVDGVTVVASLDDMLGRSDHVVLAAPYTPATHQLLDARAFAAMRPSAHLVNIARGSMVDQDALLAALDAGELAFASLDVVEPEPLPAGHPLYTHPKVRVSPHISSSSPVALDRLLEFFVENVRRYRSGETLLAPVDVDAGY